MYSQSATGSVNHSYYDPQASPKEVSTTSLVSNPHPNSDVELIEKLFLLSQKSIPPKQNFYDRPASIIESDPFSDISSITKFDLDELRTKAGSRNDGD